MKRIASNTLRGFFLAFLLVCGLPGRSQYYSMGADPAGITWCQTNVRGFNLIYPESKLSLAARYSAIFSNILDPVTASMQADIRNMPVILHPYASYSNGTSILAPRRIELYPKQPIALETNDFASQLVIHEVRHFAQMDRLNTGFTKAAGYVLGEQAQSLVLGIHVPTWLLEGDAVLTETLLSHGGRGRIAGFIQPLRSRLIDNKDVSWDRVIFGTYNEILPDEYLVGYFLTARGRMLADPLLWSDALHQIGRNPFIIKGLSGITRPKTGFRFSKLYVETIEWLRDYWTDPSMAVSAPGGIECLAKDSVSYLNYFRPRYYSDHEVICLKKSISELPSFVIIDSSGQEKRIIRAGYIEDAGFAYSDGKLVWAELIQDPRWENRSWSELFIYDLKSGTKKKFTSGKRYFSPVFSPTGNRLAVIDEQADGNSVLQVLDSSDGSVILSVPESGNNHFSYLCWGSSADELFCITTGAEGRKLVMVRLKDLSLKVLLDAGFTDIASPAAVGDRIYFSGPAGATQGLFCYNLNSGVTELVFQHPHGINYLSTHGETLYLSAYSSSGYRPAKIPLGSLRGKPVSRIEPLAEPITSIIQRAEGEFPVTYTKPTHPLSVKPYGKAAHLFRFHSWSPVFLNPDSYQVNPGVVLMSQNDLSTLTSWGGYQFNKTDLSHNLLASMKYTGLYPVLQLDYNRKYRHPDEVTDSTINRSSGFPGAYRQFLRLSAAVPLSFSSGAWSRRIQPAAFFELVGDLQNSRAEINQSAWMTGFSLSTYIVRKLSYRDLFPKWGALLNMSWFRAFANSGRGNNMTGRIMLYLPGLLPNSSLRILNSARILTSGQFLNSVQDYPRGQVVTAPDSHYNFKADYAFPVSYPDYHISWLIYIKRIKTDIFFDAGTGLDELKWFMSTGLDLTFDFHLLRSGIALESGVRLMYFPTTRKPGAEMLFSFSVN